MSVDHCPTCHRPSQRSFLYPPFLEDAAALIAYYEDIEIDDAIVSKFIDAYGAARAEWATDHMAVFDADLAFKYSGNKEKIEQLHWEEFYRMETLHPTHANPIFARDITRAIQMARIADWCLGTDEIEKLLEHHLTLTNGVNQSIRAFKERYLVGQYEADLI